MKVSIILFFIGIIFISISAKPFQQRSEQSNHIKQSIDKKIIKKTTKEEAFELLGRFTREAVKSKENYDGRKGNKGKGSTCKYRKGPWSACDIETKVRTRTFTLKKGDATTCELTKTLRKECKAGKKRGGKQRNSPRSGNKSKNHEKSDKSRN